MSLFDGFKRKKAEEKKESIKDETTNLSTVNDASPSLGQDDSEGFYFENPLELAAYGKLFGNGKKVFWLSGDNYIKEYQKGYQLFEQGQFNKALEAYKNCLKLNPIGISARFEMCETYLRLRNLASAKQTLLDMKDFLIEEKAIAKFYRRFGFIAIEQGNYREAAACYQYSLKFENHPSVSQELMYIKSKGGFAATSGTPEKVLANAKIPVLSKPQAK